MYAIYILNKNYLEKSQIIGTVRGVCACVRACVRAINVKRMKNFAQTF